MSLPGLSLSLSLRSLSPLPLAAPSLVASFLSRVLSSAKEWMAASVAKFEIPAFLKEVSVGFHHNFADSYGRHAFMRKITDARNGGIIYLLLAPEEFPRRSIFLLFVLSCFVPSNCL
jgi:hypothetical protein